MAHYEITVTNPRYTNYDAEKRYGIQFNNGVAYVADDKMWVTTGPNGPMSTVSTPVWKVFEQDHGYTVRLMEPEETPMRDTGPKATDPRRARD
jgi:hypothetical protein